MARFGLADAALVAVASSVSVIKLALPGWDPLARHFLTQRRPDWAV